MIAILLFAGALVLGVWDGVKNEFGFLQFFGRFVIVLYIMELYDIFSLIGIFCAVQIFPAFLSRA